MPVSSFVQTPIEATAPKHAEAKGHRHEPLQTRAGNAFSGLTSNMDRCQKSDIDNTHGMNGDFIKTDCRLDVQGQTEPPAAQHNHCSKYEVDNPNSLAPFPISSNKSIMSGDLLNETDLHRSIPPNTKAECIQGRCGASEFRKQDISILGPNNADFRTITGPDLDLGLEILSSQPIGARKILLEEQWNKSRIVDDILNNTSRAKGDSILNGSNGTVVQNGGCGRTTRKVKTLLHSATGRQLIQPLNERSVVTLQGVSREVQPDQTATVRITRDTCYADPSGI